MFGTLKPAEMMSMALLDRAVSIWHQDWRQAAAMRYLDMQDLVDQAAQLLPEPPRAGNHDGYAGWTALTIDTGTRLAAILGGDPHTLRSLLDDDHWTPVACRQRRRLLLTVALYTARQRHKEPARPCRPRVVVGNVVEATVSRTRSPAGRG
jgi:hypothetical protein